MSWNHANQRFGKTFGRHKCPICGANISKFDPRGGGFDGEVVCTQDKKHYRNFFSVFVDNITILGRKFDPKQVEEIEAYLDEVGNPEFK